MSLFRALLSDVLNIGSPLAPAPGKLPNLSPLEKSFTAEREPVPPLLTSFSPSPPTSEPIKVITAAPPIPTVPPTPAVNAVASTCVTLEAFTSTRPVEYTLLLFTVATVLALIILTLAPAPMPPPLIPMPKAPALLSTVTVWLAATFTEPTLSAESPTSEFCIVAKVLSVTKFTSAMPAMPTPPPPAPLTTIWLILVLFSASTFTWPVTSTRLAPFVFFSVADVVESLEPTANAPPAALPPRDTAPAIRNISLVFLALISKSEAVTWVPST